MNEMIKQLLFLWTAIAGIGQVVGIKCNVTSNPKPFSRLPKTIVPHVYSIRMKPNLQNFTFNGHIDIDVEVEETTNSIVLNAVELVFNNVSFARNGNVINAKQWIIDRDAAVATIEFPSPIEPGTGQLSITYSGVLNDKLRGFYRSQYTTPNGEVRYAATTQFESTDARKAFPCWDEPAIKAKFNVTLVVPKDRMALSNMKVIAEEPDADPSKNVVKFDTSPIMSTYLVAFIVSEYDYIEDVTPKGVKVRMYTPLGKKEQGRFALDVALKAIKFYEEYFNIPYPLPKMDLIAIADFGPGAMENWGIITFREVLVLFDEKHSSALSKQMIALCVAHELAHQWFGNLVTMEWWTHLWLKESFAQFIEYLCVANLFPEYNVWTQFVTQVTLNVAMPLDALHSTHPIEVAVGHPSEVSQISGAISYRKGASIIRMMSEYIGDELFRRGLNLYLKKHAYKNTVTEDLWTALKEVSRKPVEKVMNTWTTQKGFPVITVSSRQEGNNRILNLTQEKFCLNGKLSDDDKKSLWNVPISIVSQSSPTVEIMQLLLDSESTEVVLKNVGENEWVKLNPRSVGFYRVQYTSKMLSQFIPSVKDRSMIDMDRAGIHNDVCAMAQSGRTSTVDLLKITKAYVEEDNYSAWNSINECLGLLSTLLSHTDFHDNFNAYGRQLLQNVKEKLGWNPKTNESHLDTMLRTAIISRLVALRDPNTISESKQRFNSYLNNGIVIPADIRSAVYRAVAIDANDTVFESFLELYRKSDFQEEKNRIVISMTETEDKNKLQKILQFAFSDEVRAQDSNSVLIHTSMNKYGREIAWRFFQENFAEIQRRYEGSTLDNIVEHLTKNFASEEKALEVETFFESHQLRTACRSLKQSLEYIRLNAAWLSRDKESIREYLSIYS